MSKEAAAATWGRRLGAGLGSRKLIEEALAGLLAALDGRAAALFAAVEEMDPEAANEFAAATERVSLNQTGLGIVAAALHAVPAVAERRESGPLSSSAAWLERFGAEHSLAVPVLTPAGILGVLAISTSAEVGPGTATRRTLERIAADLAEELAGTV